MTPPEAGTIVQLRSRQYLVEDVIAPLDENGDTQVRLSCLDDDAQGEALEVFWEREVDALRSITVAQHLFGIENIVIVHHTHCGATSFTADGIIDAYKHEHNADISTLYERESVSISDFATSLEHDVRLVRESNGTPQHVNIYGYLYNIDTQELSLLVEGKAPRSDPKYGGKAIAV
ncbi:hypothetical protein [Synechococcus sp. PCC 7336]|uniref:hypothetical protein n=1 Tax=Synechococcus sp. PCC 7336 TaxID=195250 RepID=UPI000345E249|nr:hypothetical protein [Synechococcus sp. PCC 7336]